MSTALDQFTKNLESQNEILGKARYAYLQKEAERKHFEAVLIREAQGKSHAERTINAQATDKWRDFMKALARLEAAYEFQKLKFDILDKEWQANYLAQKLDGSTIRRMGA